MYRRNTRSRRSMLSFAITAKAMKTQIMVNLKKKFVKKRKIAQGSRFRTATRTVVGRWATDSTRAVDRLHRAEFSKWAISGKV